jgi:hypothetical protein
VKDPKRLRCGFVGEDGRVFAGYHKGFKSGEYWVTPERWEKIQEKQRAYVKKWDAANPGRREKMGKLWAERNQTWVSERNKAYRSRNKKRLSAGFKQWYSKNKQAVSEKKKAQRQADPDKYRAMSKRWAAANPEKRKAMMDAWRAKNGAREKETARTYYWENRGRLLANRSLYDKRFPEKRAAKDARRRANLNKARLMLHRDQEAIIVAIYDTCIRVSSCTGIPHHVDHIIPITRGGHHGHTNLQLLPARINLAKSNKLPHEITS